MVAHAVPCGRVAPASRIRGRSDCSVAVCFQYFFQGLVQRSELSESALESALSAVDEHVGATQAAHAEKARHMAARAEQVRCCPWVAQCHVKLKSRHFA